MACEVPAMLCATDDPDRVTEALDASYPHLNLATFEQSTGGGCCVAQTHMKDSIILVFQHTSKRAHANPYPDAMIVPPDFQAARLLHFRLVMYRRNTLDSSVEKIGGKIAQEAKEVQNTNAPQWMQPFCKYLRHNYETENQNSESNFWRADGNFSLLEQLPPDMFGLVVRQLPTSRLLIDLMIEGRAEQTSFVLKKDLHRLLWCSRCVASLVETSSVLTRNVSSICDGAQCAQSDEIIHHIHQRNVEKHQQRTDNTGRLDGAFNKNECLPEDLNLHIRLRKESMQRRRSRSIRRNCPLIKVL